MHQNCINEFLFVCVYIGISKGFQGEIAMIYLN